MPKRWCPRCKGEVDIALFGIRPGGSYQSYCKPCKKEYSSSEDQKEKKRNSYWRDRENRLEQVREYINSPKGKLAAYINKISKRYQITEEDLRSLMDKQKGCCGICGVSLVIPKSSRTFNIDHVHGTFKVRGLLCTNCNTLLGHSKDSETLLFLSIDYLRRSENEET